jgi:hypothetical protein
MTWLAFFGGMVFGLMFGIFTIALLAGGAKRVPRPPMWDGVNYPDVE